ncbi:MAG: hypothetical protein QG603_304 [Patescibacteria group bacterium]|nr:hypothetical protein [Patescibacteria group bacterium]
MSIIYSKFILATLRERSLFLFDLDRTLVKTEWSYTLAVLRQVIRNCGGRVFPESRVLEDFWIGDSMPRNEFIKRVLKIKPDDFWSQYHQLDLPESRVARTVVMPGVERSLRWLRFQNKMLGIVTAAYPALAQAEADLIDCHFDSILSVSLHPRILPKPAPDGLLWSMRQFGCSPDETIYVGDSAEDYACAQAAGVDFIHLQQDDRCFSFAGAQPLLTFEHWENSPFLQM